MSEWEWDELEDLMKILVDTEASRDEQYDLAVIEVNRIIKRNEVLEKQVEGFKEFLKPLIDLWDNKEDEIYNDV